jgi:Tol biopolymer transport system component/subtilisin-like proprotein convertase family protein
MKNLTRVFLAFVLLIVSTGLNRAGTGTFKTGAFNFCVSVRFNATADELQKIRTGFQQASELLEDATDGRHYFGNVSIVNNDQSAALNADFWIVPSNSSLLLAPLPTPTATPSPTPTGSPTATPAPNPPRRRSNAQRGQYGIRGKHAVIDFADFGETTTNPSGAQVLLAARTIVHEFGHYAYSLGDEYEGPNGAAECPAPAVGNAPDNRGEFNYCLMDGQHTGKYNIWFDDALPAGATPTATDDPWTWVTTNPAPYKNTQAHQSPNATGLTQHSFTGATSTMTPKTDELVFAYVYLDPVNPPQAFMLRWRENGNWVGVTWGNTTLIPLWPKYNGGALPPTGKWWRLAFMAKDLTLENKNIDGMAFLVYGGKVTWDIAGTISKQPGFSASEFCVSSNHDKANAENRGLNNTNQTLYNHQSCWETMASLRGGLSRRWKLSAFSGLPVETPPAAPHQVTFDTICGRKKIVLLIDRSGSMAQDNNRLVFAKLGASQFVRSFEEGDYLGLVSFSSNVTVNYPLSEVDGDNTRAAITSSINALEAFGGTDIGDGLLAALSQLTDEDCNCEKTIVLLTDGEHNIGTPPEAVLPALQKAGVRVVTAAVGASLGPSGEESMQHMAEETAGQSFSLSSAFDPSGTPTEAYSDASLIGFFAKISNDLNGKSMLTQQREIIAANQTREFDVFVEQNATSVSFSMNATDQADQLTLTLRTPAGVIITESDASSNPNIKFETSPGSQTFHIQTPESGTWKVVATTETIQTGKFELLAFVDHPGLQLNAQAKLNTDVNPAVIEVQANPTFEGVDVTGVVITGNVVKPDGTRASITLYDDGLEEHGDVAIHDGIYNGRFTDMTGGGSYTFELTAVNTNGLLNPGEDDLSPTSWETVPPFTRVANAMASIPVGSLNLSLGVTKATTGPGSDGDGLLEPGEDGLLKVFVINQGATYARNLTGTVTSSTPGVTVTSGVSDYPDIPSPIGNIFGGIDNTPITVNNTPFTFSLAPNFPCMADIQFAFTVTQAGTNFSQTFNFTIPTAPSVSPRTGGRFNGPPVAIPDNDPAGADIPVEVSGSVGNLAKIIFTTYGGLCSTDAGSSLVGLNHSAVGDLVLRLTSPQGTTVTLVDRAGGIGHNFCRLTLDDSGTRSIQELLEAEAPFRGRFKPANPLAAFNGENPRGTWVLNVSDQAPGDTGYLREFSLSITGSFQCDLSPDAMPTPTPELGPTFGTNARLAFTSGRDGNSEIYVMDYLGKNATRLTVDPESDEQPVWSPAADKIAFLSTRANRRDKQIYAMNADGTDPIQVSTEPNSKYGMAWSPDATKIAYSTSEGAIIVANADGSGSRILSQGGFAADPSWSPDGTKIAFAHRGNSGDRQVYVINANGSNQLLLTNSVGNKYGPVWSPDGGRILYQNFQGSGAQLFVMDADGGNQIMLTSDAGFHSEFSWSPDGSRILFVHQTNGTSTIDVMNADGSGAHTVSHNSGFDYEPEWAPDGSRIVFTGDDGIYVVNADGSHQKRYSDGWTADFYPTWQPIPTKLIVGIVEPGNGQTVTPGSTLTVRAKAFARIGTVAQVEFFADGNSIGVAANPADPSITWTVPAGSHRLAAVATGSTGITSSSLPVNVRAMAAPEINITSPADQSSVSAGSAITLMAETSAGDGTIDTVKFFANGVALGAGTLTSTNHYQFQWNLVAAGAYDFTAAATNGAGTTTSSPVHVTVNPLAGGFLATTVTQSPTSVDLTAQGTLDWAHWGLGSISGFDHKAGTQQQISNFTRVGKRSVSWFSDNTTSFSWTDGTPTGSVTGTPTGLFISGQGNGFEFSVPADSSLKTLKLYVGAWYAQGHLQATLSDQSAGVVLDESVNSNAGATHAVYTIRFRSVSSAQTLRVQYTLANDFFEPNGNISLEAAALITSVVAPTPTPTPTPLTPTPTPTPAQRNNVALAANGASVIASSVYSTNFPAVAVIDGDRKGLNWGSGGGWNDQTAGVYSDWLQINFNGVKSVDEIDVFTLQDDYGNPVEPTGAQTFNQYGVTDFDVQYWDGGSWLDVPNGHITGNGLVWRKFTFDAIATSSIRVVINNSLQSYSRLIEVEAYGVTSTDVVPPPRSRTNVALAANGATASASSVYSGSTGYLINAIIDGERAGLNWGNGGGWNDDTPNTYPDWAEVDFHGAKTINLINLFTLQDNYSAPSEPMETQTFNQYGIIDFNIQYWDGSVWVDVPVANVVGNNHVWRSFSFAAVTTSKVRVLVNDSLQSYSRITEVEAYEAEGGAPSVSITSPAQDATFTESATVTIDVLALANEGALRKVEFFDGTDKLGETAIAPYSFAWSDVQAGNHRLTARAIDTSGRMTTSSPVNVTVTGPFSGAINVARAINGGIARASSTYNGNFSVNGTIDGDRKGTNWGNGGGWNDATANSYPDWLQVDFNGTKTLNEINIFTVQDNYSSPSAPSAGMTFTQYGITDFAVQYWDGSTWVMAPNSHITDNNLVKRQLSLPGVTTTSIRLVVNNSQGSYSRIVELEAYGVPSAQTIIPPPSNVALASRGATITASSSYSSGLFPASAVIDGDRRGFNWGAGSGWNDDTAGIYPDWIEIDFGGDKTINEIDVFTLQDDYGNPVDPTETMTFLQYGIIDFNVQYWDGYNWLPLPSGSVNGNNNVRRKFSFAEITTRKIKVEVNNSLATYSRITEVEVYGH